MIKLRKVLLYIHIGALIVPLLINILLSTIFEIVIASYIVFIFKILFYISAFILFFFYVKPFKKRAIYFSLYVFSPLIIFLGWLIDGIFGAILGSIFLFFFIPNDIRFENDNLLINKKFQGFLGSCCKYEVIEKKMFLFEKKTGEFDSEEDLYLKKSEVEIQKDNLKIHLVLKDYDYKEDHYIAKDTVIWVILK